MPGYSRRMNAARAHAVTEAAQSERTQKDSRQSLGRRKDDLLAQIESIIDDQVLPKIKDAAECGDPYTSVLFDHDEVASEVCTKLVELGYQTHYFRAAGSKKCVVVILW